MKEQTFRELFAEVVAGLSFDLPQWVFRDGAAETDLPVEIQAASVRLFDLACGYTYSAGVDPDLDENRIAELARMPYEEYLQTSEWRNIRERAIEVAEGRCQVCNSPDSLNVHHRRYPKRGTELNADLVVLCRVCHAVFHARIKLCQ